MELWSVQGPLSDWPSCHSEDDAEREIQERSCAMI